MSCNTKISFGYWNKWEWCFSGKQTMFQKNITSKTEMKRHRKIENVECIGINLSKEVKLWNAAGKKSKKTYRNGDICAQGLEPH